MRNDNRYFDVFPRIVRTRQETTITIRPLYDHVRFGTETPEIHIYPAEGGKTETTKASPTTPKSQLVDGASGKALHGNQMYAAKLLRNRYDKQRQNSFAAT